MLIIGVYNGKKAVFLKEAGMRKVSEKGRKILRMILQGLGTVTVSLLFQSCYGPVIVSAAAYGMPPGSENSVTIQGTVRSLENQPVPGIKVSVKDVPVYGTGSTNTSGNFYLDYIPQQESYRLTFEDVDGPENGSFKTLEKDFTPDDINRSLQIHLEEADEE
jgi:putative lipoprotein (rSAM/lipoprotein system)